LNNYLIQDETLALPCATADGDDADGLLDKLERSDGFRIHAELPLLIAIDEAYGPGGAGDWRCRRGRRRGDGGGGRGRVGGAIPASVEKLEHLSPFLGVYTFFFPLPPFLGYLYVWIFRNCNTTVYSN